MLGGGLGPSLLEVLDAIAVAELVFRVVTKSTKWGVKAVLDRTGKPGERRELVRHLFFGQGDFRFHAGNEWRPAKGQKVAPITRRGYPHELLAATSFVPFFDETAVYEDTLFFKAPLNPEHRIVTTGSPKSNDLARRYLPSFEKKEDGARQQHATLISPGSLKYLFGEDLTAPKVQVVSMMRHGATEAKTRKVLWRSRGKDDFKPWRPDGYSSGEELRRDFLLVSRLPTSSIGGDILIFAGGHGAGTEATRLLLHKLKMRELKKLVDLLGSSPYYQFVIEVTEVKHPKTGTVPKAVRLCEDPPPEVLNISAAHLLERAVKSTKVWR